MKWISWRSSPRVCDVPVWQEPRHFVRADVGSMPADIENAMRHSWAAKQRGGMRAARTLHDSSLRRHKSAFSLALFFHHVRSTKYKLRTWYCFFDLLKIFQKGNTSKNNEWHHSLIYEKYGSRKRMKFKQKFIRQNAERKKNQIKKKLAQDDLPEFSWRTIEHQLRIIH